MQLERSKQLRFRHPGSHPMSDARGVVKNHMSRYGTDMFKHAPQPVRDTLGSLAPIPLDEAHVREREGHHEDVQDLPDPGDDGLGLPEIDLHCASRPD